jgi:hypothetical protein
MKITFDFQLGDDESAVKMAAQVLDVLQEKYCQRRKETDVKYTYVADYRQIDLVRFEV